MLLQIVMLALSSEKLLASVTVRSGDVEHGRIATNRGSRSTPTRANETAPDVCETESVRSSAPVSTGFTRSTPVEDCRMGIKSGALPFVELLRIEKQKASRETSSSVMVKNRIHREVAFSTLSTINGGVRGEQEAIVVLGSRKLKVLPSAGKKVIREVTFAKNSFGEKPVGEAGSTVMFCDVRNTCLSRSSKQSRKGKTRCGTISTYDADKSSEIDTNEDARGCVPRAHTSVAGKAKTRTRLTFSPSDTMLIPLGEPERTGASSSGT
jgi:hypothetical protein